METLNELNLNESLTKQTDMYSLMEKKDPRPRGNNELIVVKGNSHMVGYWLLDSFNTWDEAIYAKRERVYLKLEASIREKKWEKKREEEGW